MPDKFYIADWHYGHTNCLAFDNRPFKTIEDMNIELVRRWNDTVGNGDLVYVLGDMFWCNPQVAIPVLKSLNGQKILIKGNHDRTNSSEYIKCFQKVTDYLEVEDRDKKIVLCHYPIPCYRNHFYGWYHFYGHVHSSFEWNMMEHDQFLMRELYGERSMMVNVGAMMPWMDYTPRMAKDIIEDYKEWKTNEGGQS